MEKLINIISENFWLLLLLGIMVKNDLNIAAIIIVCSQMIFGYKLWVVMLTLLLAIANEMADKQNSINNIIKRKNPDYK